MNVLTDNLWCLILCRVSIDDIRKIMMIKQIHSPQLWRSIFFKIARKYGRSWFAACRALISKRDSYYVRCYQCSWSVVYSIGRPQFCSKCGLGLSLKDTSLVQYPSHPK